jgi:hypothetical protein
MNTNESAMLEVIAMLADSYAIDATKKKGIAKEQARRIEEAARQAIETGSFESVAEVIYPLFFRTLTISLTEKEGSST